MFKMRDLARTVLVLLCVTSAFAAPRDRVDPKRLKDPVSLKLGSKGVIQFKQQGETLTAAKFATNANDGGLGVDVQLKRDELLLVLVVKNRFPKALHYHAAIRLKGQTEFIEVSTAEIGPGLSGFENWDDPIEELVLFGFKLSD